MKNLLKRWQLTENKGGFKEFFSDWNKLYYYEKDSSAHFYMVTYLKKLNELAIKHFGQSEGDGSTRSVYEIEEGLLLKTAVARYPQNNPAWGLKYNELEAMNKMATKFPELFPKVYQRAEDYSWIVVEQVEVITDEDYWDHFFPEVADAIEKWGLWTESVYMWVSYLLYKNAAFKNNHSAVNDIVSKLNNFHVGEGFDAELFFEDIDGQISPLLSRVVDLVNEFKVDPDDLGPGNCGISAGGNFVILDASIWGDTGYDRFGKLD